jgi:hypothetical protein
VEGWTTISRTVVSILLMGLSYRKFLTRDMGGDATTLQFTKAILDKLDEVHKL